MVGCSVFDIGKANNNNQKSQFSNDINSKVILDSEALNCVNLISCSLVESYTNALGQKCQIVLTLDNEKKAFCSLSSNQETTNQQWEQITIL